MKKILFPLLAALVFIPRISVAEAPPADAATRGPTQNVILMIADGGGFNHFRAASAYMTGQATGLIWNSFPVRLAVSTFSASGQGYDPGRAARDAGEKGDQCRLQRIGQDIDGIVSACCQLPRQTPARFQRYLAVAEGAVDDRGDFAHALQYRGDPARGQGVELQPWVPRVQPREQRLRHDGVANPGWGNDQRTRRHLNNGNRSIRWRPGAYRAYRPHTLNGPWAIRP